MSRSTLYQWIRQLTRSSRPARNKRRPSRLLSGLEPLEERVVLSVSASFIPAAGVLNVLGDFADNNIVVSRDAAGHILVNGGAVSVTGGTPTVANTARIQVFGLAGNDHISLDETNGALPAANLFGGAGNDTLIGGSANDLLFGQAGSDTLLGKGGIDFLFGGAGNDTLTGGTGNDQVFGEAGDDRMIWNPGDGSDLNEGGAGIDTVEVNGGNGAETFAVTPNGTRVRFDRIDPAPFSIDIGTSENLILNANGGDDVFTGANGLAPLISLTVDGGAGNDTLTGGDGADVLLGGDGNDIVNGGRGNDVVFLGAGDDSFTWNPGDGSDTVEGQDGNDTMIFNGANVNEKIDLSANGSRLTLSRNVGSVTMDTNGVENVNINALGGADAITLNDLSATSVEQVNIDLGAIAGAIGGDSQIDTVTVNATNAADAVQLFGNGTSYVVSGLASFVTVANSEGALDNLQVNLLDGSDNFDASALPVGVTRLTVDGGSGDDQLTGSQGDDLLLGGDGNDLVFGGRGDDVALLGDGNDTFVWNPGDGSDTFEGQAGFDTMVFNGSDASENIDISANGSRVRFFRDVGNVTMDVNGVEQLNVAALGGADTITVNDLTGTDVTTVNLNLAAANGDGDGQADNVVVNGTNGNDMIVVASSVTNGLRIGGLAAVVRITAPDSALDQLTVNALGGNDTVDASGVDAGVLHLTINGGAGDDVIYGSQGDDLVNGGQGSDIVFLGDGDDTFVWNPGDGSDIVEGQGGNDTMLFNGANVNEHIDISANGQRVRFFRDVANVTMDLNDVERIDFNALGGADTIVVNDLSGTDVTEVNLSLKATGGGGDAQPDNVIVNGTYGDDAIFAFGDASGTSVLGLTAQINIVGAEPANDRLTINALAGDDAVDATGLAADAILLTLNGGDDDDVLIGGAGNDTLTGGVGDDVLIGGPGLDILDGGPGNNILIQD
jgi:Ca2+-binding RTX toxin-like protein